MARPLGDELSQLRLTGGGCAEPDEQSRIQQLQAGSEEAFNWLVATYASTVYRLAYRLLNNPADSSDIVQEVFLRVFRGVRHFEGHCALRTWIYHIAVNTVWNQNRWWRRHREQERPLQIPDGDFGTEKLDVVDESQNPLQDTLTLEAQQLVWKALLRLNESQRLILVLREMEDLSYDEVAAILNLTAGTVKSRLARARLALKRELEPMLAPAPRPAPVWHLAE
ncbi:MAG: sigma-70 family RNA polymerase sigma factor [Acidobacteria bacterium]|nr:sigma-70 family RNA polymerase sigma factor [Acidobacteriota bacterium]